jgi:hypothetical protein
LSDNWQSFMWINEKVFQIDNHANLYIKTAHVLPHAISHCCGYSSNVLLLQKLNNFFLFCNRASSSQSLVSVVSECKQTTHESGQWNYYQKLRVLIWLLNLMMDNNGDTKIYRINSTRTNFIYTSDTPEEDTNIVYNR